jgi:5'-nucleotidase
MRVLVTNDDGVDSAGILVLAGAARELGVEVVIAAPSWDSSGASAALTAVQKDGQVVMKDLDASGLSGVRMLSVEAAPAFIARAAVRGAFGPPPDVVLSGINAGPNTGQAVLHSGTVGAALTAFTHGCTAMAVSIAAHHPQHWDTAAHIARPIIDWLLKTPEPVLLNVNVPDRHIADVRGLKPAQLATFGSVQTHVTEADDGHVRIEYAELATDEADTDAALLAAGYATITPLLAISHAGEIDVSGLTPGN